MEKAYYNHDHLWDKRHYMKWPVWGPHSDAAYHNILNRLLHLQPTAEHLFDAGCGAGAMGLLALRRNLRYTGADESSVAIAMGQKAYPHLDLRHCDLVREVPEDCTGKMSAIACVNVLHCLTDPQDRLSLLRHLHTLGDETAALALTTMCLPLLATFRKADSPRAYLEAEEIYAEFDQAGWGDLVLREFLLADSVSPVTNLLIIARKSKF